MVKVTAYKIYDDLFCWQNKSGSFGSDGKEIQNLFLE